MRTSLPPMTGPRVPWVVRLVLLLLCTAVIVSQATDLMSLLWAVPLALLGYVSTPRGASQTHVLLLTCAEGLLAAIAVTDTGWGRSAYLPYLIAPAFAGGLGLGLLGGVLPVGAATAIALFSPLVAHVPASTALSADVAQWAVLAVLVGGVAAWVRSALEESHPDAHVAEREAFRLLTELRAVARQLPGTLDPATSAQAMLEKIRQATRFDNAAVLVAPPGGRRLSVVARMGHHRPEWDLTLDGSSPLGVAWETQKPYSAPRQLPRRESDPQPGSSLVLPLQSGAGTFGLVVLESGVAQAFPPETVDRVSASVSSLAMQLQTGLVFDEVRELATHEERRRLAREIHDGIAQELASLAYALDTVATDLEGDHPISEQVDGIRNEVRRLVSELRMSLFDLRLDVDPDEGLGAAIGRHVRTVGTASGLTVHLSLNEGPLRLAAETEAELLRIVQEAVANTRKHAQATNLWVSCTVDPPAATIVVEDDGVGVLGSSSPSSHGLAIMAERAERIRATLTVKPRVPQGTMVQLTVGRVPS